MARRIGSLVVGLAACLLAGCGGKGSAAAPAASQPAAVAEVEVYEAAQRDAAGVIRASGVIAYKHETSLSFSAAGTIETISADVGDRVSAGQVVATLRRTSVGADSAESEIVRTTAQQTFDRVKRLFDAGAASQADLDSARVALERTRAGLSVAAPASGVVLRRAVERGQVVAAGQAVLVIGEAAAGVIVRASVSSAQVRQIREGDPVEIQLRGQSPRPGVVSRLSPTMTEGMSSYQIEVRPSEQAGLRSGEVAETLIRTSQAPAAEAKAAAPAFVIPAIALIDARADQGAVFVIGQDGKASRRSVQTEGLTDAGVVIVNGLAPGDLVVTRGASMLRDGDPVRVRKG